MEKKEFAIGETFQFGLKKLKVVEGNCCADCYLRRHEISDCCLLVGECWRIARTDEKSVIFIEVEDK